jgi:DNA-binding NtrC family response regulator
MRLNPQRQHGTEPGVHATLVPSFRPEPRILIVCEDDSIAERLNIALAAVGFLSERTCSMTEGCTAATSGRFHVIFTQPVLADGSWRRLTDLAEEDRAGFVVVLVASDMDFNQAADALREGAFDVLDPLHELPQAAEAGRCALWAAYLKGGRPLSHMPPS